MESTSAANKTSVEGSTDFDVIVIGAGLSGIGAGVRLQRDCPDSSFAILERRGAIGGTWDIFRYPGIRSDSDMHTLGYDFKPWSAEKAIADGTAIREYVNATADEYGVRQHIRFEHQLKAADWCSERSQWILSVELAGNTVEYRCNVLLMCAGYYSYDAGYQPDFPGKDTFAGTWVHPQFWPRDLDYSNKKVVVIGSGATAMTLVPNMASTAEHVTMLQRSPTYVVARPAVDSLSQKFRRWFPEQFAYDLTRWKNVTMQAFIFQLSRRFPDKVRALLRKMTHQWMGDDYDIDTHFNPRYNPWDQRLCLVPDGDLFRALRKGTASIVTDHIEHFTEQGIQLKSGAALDADIVVSATGLELLILGGIQLTVDSQPVKIADSLVYKGMMFSGIPNLALAAGYTNASWTLKCDLTSQYVCRLLAYMDKHNYKYCMATNSDPSVQRTQFLDLASGYIDRAVDQFPKQGNKAPWRLYQNYLLDIITLRVRSLRDRALTFYKTE